MLSRFLSHRLRSIAFYRDEIAIVVVGVAHQLLVAGVSLPGFTVATERDMVVRIADVHAAAAVQVGHEVRHELHAVRAEPLVPSATFEMPALPVPELEAARLAARGARAARVPRALPAMPAGARFRVVAPLAPAVAPAAHVAPVPPAATDLDVNLSESALRTAVERARVEQRVRAAVARALAAEQASRRVTVEALN